MQYRIDGTPLPVVSCTLAAGETMITESGAMAWMTPNMRMETTGGGMGRMLGRMFSGESLFLNRYTAVGGEGMIAFASSFPGSIMPVEIGPGKGLICQKKAFLAGEAGVELSVFFQKKLASGLFGGEGFISSGCRDRERRFWRSTDTRWSISWRRGSHWWWIPVISPR